MPRIPDALPDFFVLGVAKSGTTSLHDYLRQHPDLFLPYVKELDFFDAEEGDYATRLDQYLQYFTEADDRLTGEATPSYFRHADPVIGRMHQLYGNAAPRFLLVLRDPVERAYSHYLHNVAEGREPLSFAAALKAERRDPAAKRADWKSYFGDGVYADTLATWFDAFSRDRFLILLSAELDQRPDVALRRIFRFLDVAPGVAIDTDKRLNRTGERQSSVLGALLSGLPSWLPTLLRQWVPESVWLGVRQFIRRRSTGTAADRPTLAPDLKQHLRTRYLPHVQRLEAMIDRDLSAWKPSTAAPSASPAVDGRAAPSANGTAPHANGTAPSPSGPPPASVPSSDKEEKRGDDAVAQTDRSQEDRPQEDPPHDGTSRSQREREVSSQ
jgi:hypothetical protein